MGVPPAVIHFWENLPNKKPPAINPKTMETSMFWTVVPERESESRHQKYRHSWRDHELCQAVALTCGRGTLHRGGFQLGQWGYPQLAGWFVSWKIPSKNG